MPSDRLDALHDRPRPWLMGIVNVTPDSFSDGGRFDTCDTAADHGQRLLEEGADLLDIGGESTRPGAAPISAEEEIRRVGPVLAALRKVTALPLSVDTRKPAVAREALERGADLVNDVSAAGDPEMMAVCREYSAGLVLMHMQGVPATMQQDPCYRDVLAEVEEFLSRRAGAAREAGIPADRLWLDPGIGFGKTLAHNLALLRGVPRLAALGYPLVLGLSRKSWLGQLTGRPVEERLPGTLAAALWCAARGAAILRVHDVRPHRDALATWQALLGRRRKR